MAMSSLWRLVKKRDIGSHMIGLSEREDNDGFKEYRISLDCLVQFRGSLKDCQAEWRYWVRVLNKIQLERKEGK